MRNVLVGTVAVLLVMHGAVFAQVAHSQDSDSTVSEQAPTEPANGPHQFNSMGPWCIAGGIDVLSAAHDPASGGWAWAPGVRVMFLHVTPPHEKPSVRFLGVSVKVAMFDGRSSNDGRGLVPIFMLVPVSINGVSFEFTPYRVGRSYESSYDGPRVKGSILFALSYAWR